MVVDSCSVSELDGAGLLSTAVLRYSCTMCAWGFLSDILADIERHRWLGPIKTLFCGIKKIFAPLRTYNATVLFRPSEGKVFYYLKCS